MVVSQVFAGGGNASAPYSNDFVELFNRGSTPADLGGWSIQYASGSGTTWQVTPLTGSVQPGGHYLVQLASGAVGAALPMPDATGTSNLAVSGGKVALSRAVTALACGGSCSADPLVTDLVGYGSATDFEGTGAAPAIGNTTSALRAGDGCTDTDANSSDFSAAAPTPRNSAASTTPCSASPPPPSGGPSQSAPVDIDVDSVLSIASDVTERERARIETAGQALRAEAESILAAVASLAAYLPARCAMRPSRESANRSPSMDPRFYLDEIVRPTVLEFENEPTSVRRAWRSRSRPSCSPAPG
jgi:hypothetical protein